MIAQLDWRDFEILVDLMFACGGWQRTSAVGDGEVDVDLLLTSPTTGEAGWVQIRSQASQGVLDDYLDRFRRDGSAQRFSIAMQRVRVTNAAFVVQYDTRLGDVLRAKIEEKFTKTPCPVASAA